MKLSKQTYTYIFFAILFVILIIAVWYFFFRGKTKCDPNKPGYDIKGNLNKKCVVEEPKEPPPSGTSGWSAEKFPLDKGMYGVKIKVMQQALIDKYGKSILPKWGADGKFGDETKTALTSKGYSVPLTEPEYNKIIEPASPDIGKSAYAKNDWTIYYLGDGSEAMANKDQKLGVIIGTEGEFYKLAGQLKVHKNKVYLKNS